MRLLNTRTLEFGDFYDDAIPPYAILSHRWRDDEVSYQDLLAPRKRGGAGFVKIARACELVANDSLENDNSRENDCDHTSWIWIDTCCINKESSSELSEAINSMWRWYQNSAVCYAYLDDVPEKPVTVEECQDMTPSSETANSLLSFKAQFRESEWFTRGWTLQELLAPQKVEFLSRSWTRLGNKVELCDDISTATGIDRRVILGDMSIQVCLAAQKFSWAASRRTSRTEDMAYCLLGLLDINMPLLYGEGSKAFERLQEELVRSSNDESMFAWLSFTEPSLAFTLSPLEQIRKSPLDEIQKVAKMKQGMVTDQCLFADTPSRFAGCGNIKHDYFDYREPFQMANIGLRIDAVLIPLPNHENEFLAPLNCCIPNRGYPNAPLALHLFSLDPERNLYSRAGCVDLARPEFAQIRSWLKWKRVRTRGLVNWHIFNRHHFAATQTSRVTSLLVLPLMIYLLRERPLVAYMGGFAYYFWAQRRHHHLIYNMQVFALNLTFKLTVLYALPWVIGLLLEIPRIAYAGVVGFSFWYDLALPERKIISIGKNMFTR